MSKKEQFIHIDKKGTKRYYSDRGMTILHREDGPAVEWFEGSKYWYINGKRHREEEFNARMNPVELTLEEIADKFEVSVDQIKIRK